MLEKMHIQVLTDISSDDNLNISSKSGNIILKAVLASPPHD